MTAQILKPIIHFPIRFSGISAPKDRGFWRYWLALENLLTSRDT
jgi:hypothetical protein